MDFEWDPAKAESNLRKHGITFDFATAVFLDPDRIEEPSSGGFDEERWITVARVGNLLFAVVLTMRGESIRIISARGANRYEHKGYWADQVHP